MTRAIALALCVGAPLAVLAATLFGSVPIDAHEWWAALRQTGDPVVADIVWRLRVPRALAAFVTGGLLALAGLLLQALLRNPLADPYVLGLSGGASIGALLAMLLGLGAALMHALALMGAALVAAALVAFAVRTSGWDIHRILLAGVGFASASGALVSLILTVAPAAQVHGMLFWLMGDLSGAVRPNLAALVLLVVAAAAFAVAPSLDALALGTDKARLLGVAAGTVQAIAFVGAAIATVAAVLIAGAIGFVGLAVPHLLRLAGVHAHATLIPLCVLAGGILVTLSDLLARTVVAPVEIPVGVATALIGVPVLLWLLRRTR
jgi:iron complex transport system permease protein